MSSRKIIINKNFKIRVIQLLQLCRFIKSAIENINKPWGSLSIIMMVVVGQVTKLIANSGLSKYIVT